MKLLISEGDIKNITNLDGYSLFSHQRRKKHIIKLIIKLCNAGSSILDIGCASGDIAIELSNLGYHVHGIDLEPHRLDEGKKLAEKYRQNVNFENAKFEDLNNLGVYDLVFCGEVLEHFTDPVQVLVKIKRLLNSNAKILITTPNMPSLRNRLKFALLGIFPDNNPEHKYYFDYKRLSSVISAAGYEIVYFTTNFTNITLKSKMISYFESFLLFWFTLIAPKSGDTIFAVISPVQEECSHDKI